ncbi:conjugal transfer nickase/helicase domain-containing protein [Pseudomonas protegens]|uniref:conjugal transfer nickase/helicase domain-containing protein n=1 Tax=Pseudomonas protegens TaxID=380021 RepID=UPI00288338E8|nr:DNA-binding domain-containing protein [Pseudomonas protegens]
MFERLDIHLKRPNGQNIRTCKVKGPHRTSSLNGYLLREAKIISSHLPADNPFLTLSS